MKVLIPGSFDPPTNGHIDVINRSLELFDDVVVGVVVNPSKTPLFKPKERSEMLEQIFKDNNCLFVESFEGLLVDFAYKHKVDAIVKGLRAMTDFDYEFQMAQANYSLAEFETIFIPSSPEFGYLSSSMVKEIHSLGGNVSGLVPSQVMERLNDGK